MAERDDFDFLRQAWNQVTPPAPRDSVDSPDPQTQRVVDWMRAAWDASQAPPARLPWRLRVSRVARSKAVWAAAAALVLALFGTSLLVRETTQPVLLTGVENPPPQPAPQPSQRGGDALIASIAHDRTEVRSGPVRLILFKQGPSDVSTSKEAR